MKLLIDTNIVLDALMDRAPWADFAQSILLATAEGKAEGCITASSLTDLHYILRKHLGDSGKTRKALLALLVSVTVLDVSGVDCKKAFELPMDDFEDALLACCAKRHRAEYIVTRDLKGFDGSPVRAIEPDVLLVKLKIQRR
ncbi:MAG: PIN domain-containing protein [Clostridiales Family XIII bacterium]|jgi:predicted nucleic acid-binding protein|nr:PIN domain-containing protein [Clostridiales Family XIII bacterium]